MAFSSGSLLNIAQGRFGPHPVQAVRWIATLGTDYGVVAVHRDSPQQSLPQLVHALREAPSKLVFGAGGTLGSQDWMKAALLVRAADQDPRKMRFVSFEGGGEAIKALESGHLGVFTGDAAEAMKALSKGAQFKLLAVLAPARLPGGCAMCPRPPSKAWRWCGPPCGAFIWQQARLMPLWPHGRLPLNKPTAPQVTPRCARSMGWPPPPDGSGTGGICTKSVEDYRALAKELGLRL